MKSKWRRTYKVRVEFPYSYLFYVTKVNAFCKSEANKLALKEWFKDGKEIVGLGRRRLFATEYLRYASEKYGKV